MAWTKGYLDPKLNLFGPFETVPGYITSILRDDALNFLDKFLAIRLSFFYLLAGLRTVRRLQHLGMNIYIRILPNGVPPNFDPADQSDKPTWLKETPQLSQHKIEKQVDELRLNQLRCLHSIDVAVREILEKPRRRPLGVTLKDRNSLRVP